MSGTAKLVEARDLQIRFVTRDATVRAVNGVSFDLAAGETLCILGESGSGKSVTLRALMRLNPPKRTVLEGTLRVGGHDLVAARESTLSDIRGRVVSMIFQEPMTALDPVFTIDARSARPSCGTNTSAAPRPTAARWTCSNWCRSPPPAAGWTPTRTRCRADCGNGR